MTLRLLNFLENYFVKSEDANTTTEIIVSGIHIMPNYPPLALGLCMSYVKQSLPKNIFRVLPTFIAEEQSLKTFIQSTQTPRRNQKIFLFSNYLWNTDGNLRLSRLAKQLSPECITIHGGPNTPTHTDACRDFLHRELHVDFIVAGEGEETLKELLEALASSGKKSIHIDGVRYLDEGRYVETNQRLRSDDINKFPSPYLTGFFNGQNITNWEAAIIETNRGCPYSCIYCDWGSIMGQKLKEFDFDRVVSEINWLADRKINCIWVADANFGILDRDVDIAQAICDAKKRTGYPIFVVQTYAKNVKTSVVEIVELMVEAGLLAQGTISLQTSDEETLRVIKRTNIKKAQFDKLRRVFEKKKLPLWVELMLALPGSTMDTFKNDLAQYFDSPIEVFVHRTVMLVNSPMADPQYRIQHQIKTRQDGMVASTATMSANCIEEASAICRLFQGAHRLGMLRYILRWLEWERGIKPLDTIHDLVQDEQAQERFPLLGSIVRDAKNERNDVSDLVDTMNLVREDLRRNSLWGELHRQFLSWITQTFGIVDNPGLRTVVTVQTALMPSPGRQFPETIELDHDMVQWYADWFGGRGEALISYASSLLTIEDPLSLSDRIHCFGSISPNEWELTSALMTVRRPRR
jgi:radical SAM superfamily enzyme YgiQ (UPF0313 family)